jgi:hypothetical protein
LGRYRLNGYREPRQTSEAFDAYLEQRGLRLEAVVVGGAALNLLGVIARATQGCDILDPDLAPEILAAAASFAADARRQGEALGDDWLNNGPALLAQQLPQDWRAHLQPPFNGRALVLEALGRLDLLRSKLFALCDRGIDIGDCVALVPTTDELAAVLPWLELQDAHPGWPGHVRATFEDFARTLGHGV